VDGLSAVPTRREIVTAGIACAFGGAGAALSVAPLSPSVSLIPGGLGALARNKGLLCGAALDVPWIADSSLMEALDRDTNVIGVANGFNWTRTQYRPDMSNDWAQAESVYAWGRKHGKLVRGHNIIWFDPVLPPWLLMRLSEATSAEVGDILVAHVRETFGHWRGRLIQQDLVNEPITSTGMRDTVWNRKLGENYIDLAFHAAAETDPTTLRILNQDWIEMDSREHDGRRNTLLHLLERLLKRGVPIQALGIEGHLQAEFPFSARKWDAFLREVTGMGLKLMVTEYDVHDRGILGDVATRDARVAALARAFFDVTLSYRQCLGIVSQSWTDRYDWLSETPSKARSDAQALRPNPLDRQYRPKPLYTAIAQAVAAAPSRHAG
jgi:endo-1,4-beta-xylanase